MICCVFAQFESDARYSHQTQDLRKLLCRLVFKETAYPPKPLVGLLSISTSDSTRTSACPTTFKTEVNKRYDQQLPYQLNLHLF